MNSKHILLEALKKTRYAHRGFHSKPEIPENSMIAFKKAVDEGFGIELDVHLTKDNRLAVIHDHSLKRTCGVDLKVEEHDFDEIKDFNLEASEEKIPELKEVLNLVQGKIPLIIELKVLGKNYKALTDGVMKSLEGYKGLYCIESFSPHAVYHLRKHYPEVVRGQLSGQLLKDGSVNRFEDFLLKNLIVNVAGKPDFVAYRFSDRKIKALDRYKGSKFMWTITKMEDLIQCELEGAAPIFEQFNPKKYLENM